MARFTGTRTPPTNAAPYDSGVLMSELYDRVTGLIFADTAGTLFFDQSISGATGEWDYVQSQAVAANVGSGFSFELIAPYYRFRYVPTTNPTVFRFSARQSSAGAR